MNRRAAILGGTALLGVLFARPDLARATASPHLSEHFLPSSNGVGAIAWDRTQNKLVEFLEHPYANASPTAQTRNFAYDSYPGLRVAGAGTWLSGVAPTLVEYLPGTGIVHAIRTVGTLTVDEYDFTPMGLPSATSLMLLQVKQNGASAAVDAYSIFNYHLGSGSPAPGTDAESITYDAARDAYVETGPSGVALAYASLGASTHHGCAPSSSGNNPYSLLQAGANLADDAATGTTTDAVAGLQRSLGPLATGATAWAGWATTLSADPAKGGAAVDAVRAWVAGRTPDRLLADEVAAWKAWTKPAATGASALEAALDVQAQVILRMGQVQEPGPGRGQILASVAPGKWNIAWVRDMAYSTVALVRSGHLAEAKAAIAFQLGAASGTYATQVGKPYQISVCRYYGDGSEWSDSNTDGPNIEFDGFGLFLWELDQYLQASHDTASLAQWWTAVKGKVADVLVGLQEPSGLIAPDSSIWEVHWNGQQKHFAYTTITASSGLCAASRIATAAGDPASAAGYLTAGQKSRDALLPNLRAPGGWLAQSTEAIAAGTGMLDASVLEAMGLGLVDPTRATASATLAAIQAGLVPQSGRGFMRSNAGDWYSSNEWVFIDLRAARALEIAGQTTASQALFAWNVAQASDNYDELSELHDPVTADYAGESPMVGFGAGAYLLALRDRGSPAAPSCGAFVAEGPASTDGGADGMAGSDAGGPTSDGGSSDSGSGAGDGGSPLGDASAAGDDGGDDGGGDAGAAGHGPGKGGCGCDLAERTHGGGALAALLPLGVLVLRRRRR